MRKSTTPIIISIISIIISLCSICLNCLTIYNRKNPNNTTTSSSNNTASYDNIESLDAVLLDIRNMQNDVVVTVQNNTAFENAKATVHGKTITEDNGKIIDEIFSCAEFGHEYDASYSVKGKYLQYATYNFMPKAQSDKPFTCGVNYYGMMMNASAYDCKKITIRYAECISLGDLTGEFEFFIAKYDNDTPMKFDAGMLIVSGKIDSTGVVTITRNGDDLILKSNEKMHGVEITTSSTNKENKKTVTSDVPANIYIIKIKNGIPSVSPSSTDVYE